MDRYGVASNPGIGRKFSLTQRFALTKHTSRTNSKGKNYFVLYIFDDY